MTDDKLRELLDGATPGPWGWHDNKLFGFAGEKIIDHAACEGMWFAAYGRPERDSANAHLIAAAPSLAAEVLRLLNENASLREQLTRQQKMLDAALEASFEVMPLRERIARAEAAFGTDAEEAQDRADYLSGDPDRIRAAEKRAAERVAALDRTTGGGE